MKEKLIKTFAQILGIDERELESAFDAYVEDNINEIAAC